MAAPRQGQYNAQEITVLEGLEPVRRRPGMYIGGTGREGLHHLLWEIVDNSVDEAINGFASEIKVVLESDSHTACVTDNGRGIPVDIHPRLGRSALEIVFTMLHAGGKFDHASYATSGGLHGVGSSVVNALSSMLVATVWRDGKKWQQEYRRGRPRSPVKEIGPFRGSGTTVRFTPDDQIFGDLAFDAETVREWLEIKSFLHPGLRIVFRDEVGDKVHEFRHEGGIRDYLGQVLGRAEQKPIMDEPFLLNREATTADSPRLALVLTWTDSPREQLLTFVNGIPTRDGGTHEQGLREALGRAIRNYIDTHDKQPRGLTLSAEDFREGIVAILSLFVREPQFQGQTKDRLNNPEVRGHVETIVRPALEQWLHANGSAADAILARAIQAARIRQAQRQAAQDVRRKSAVSRRLNLPGKLADCSAGDPERCELFVVEGDSAGGSAKQGRDRETQAILPLRGKVLNAEQASLNKVLTNNELSDLVRALGCGIGKDFDVSRLRYHRVILLMDADSDGHHISTLLLAFFYRHLPALITRGHVFLAQPPLYRINAGARSWWAADDREKDRILARIQNRTKVEITRFKGLGEMMPRTLFETTLDPKRRRLLQIEIPDLARAETEQVMQNLLGRDPSARLREITDRAEQVDDLDV